MKNLIYTDTDSSEQLFRRLEYLLPLDPALPCLLNMMAMTQVRPQKSTWHLAPVLEEQLTRIKIAPAAVAELTS